MNGRHPHLVLHGLLAASVAGAVFCALALGLAFQADTVSPALRVLLLATLAAAVAVLGAGWRLVLQPWQAPRSSAEVPQPSAPLPPRVHPGPTMACGTAVPDCHHASQALRELSEVLERSSDYVVRANLDGRITYMNPAARRAAGVDANAPLQGLNFHQFATPATVKLFAEVIVPELKTQSVWVGESTMAIGDRAEVPLSHMVIAHRDENGRVSSMSSVMRDITAAVQARHEIRRQAEILSAVTEAIPATVVVVDSTGRYRFVNGAFERYCGLPRERILGRTAVDVIGAAEVARRKPYMQRAVAGEAVEFTLDYPRPDGTTWLALACIPLKLQGVVDGFVGISQDVTAQHREQQRLHELLQRDPLTGLYNRNGFENQIDRQMQAGAGGELALLFIDLDHFKPVNDNFGHPAGDELLQQFAQRLKALVRATDAVARLGGDEFAVLLCGVRDHATAEMLAERVLAAAKAPFEVLGQRVAISASVGVAFGAHGPEGWRDLVMRADTMLYRAKASGRGRQVMLAA